MIGSPQLTLSFLLTLCLFSALAAQEPGVLKGRVLDASGKPLSGVKVFADNTLLYNSNAIAVSDSKGYYRVDVSRPVGTWRATAQLERTYSGKRYAFDLHPDKADPFAGNDGAVRNFTWKLQGERPDGGYYGSFVVCYGSLDNPFWIDTSHVELTLIPTGPLVDGSVGQAIVARLVRTAEGDAIADVPLGRYTITARYLDPERGALDLNLRQRNSGSFVPELVADFEVIMTGLARMDLEVQSR